jgi:hypothetical protein
MGREAHQKRRSGRGGGYERRRGTLMQRGGGFDEPGGDRRGDCCLGNFWVRCLERWWGSEARSGQLFMAARVGGEGRIPCRDGSVCLMGTSRPCLHLASYTRVREGSIVPTQSTIWNCLYISCDEISFDGCQAGVSVACLASLISFIEIPSIYYSSNRQQ